MKIVAVETIRVEEFPNLLWLQIRTDEGVVGLGETFFLAKRSRPTSMRPRRRS